MGWIIKPETRHDRSFCLDKINCSRYLPQLANGIILSQKGKEWPRHLDEGGSRQNEQRITSLWTNVNVPSDCTKWSAFWRFVSPIIKDERSFNKVQLKTSYDLWMADKWRWWIFVHTFDLVTNKLFYFFFFCHYHCCWWSCADVEIVVQKKTLTGTDRFQAFHKLKKHTRSRLRSKVNRLSHVFVLKCLDRVVSISFFRRTRNNDSNNSKNLLEWHILCVLQWLNVYLCACLFL